MTTKVYSFWSVAKTMNMVAEKLEVSYKANHYSYV